MSVAAEPSAPSLWHLADYDELCGPTETLWTGEADARALRVAATSRDIWLIVTARTGATVAFRIAHSPGQLSIDRVHAGVDGVTIRHATTLGAQRSRVSVADDGVVSFSTVLRPRTDVTFPAWPRDIVPLGSPRRRPNGVVHTHQHGLRTGLVHASLTGRQGASFMYLQDLVALRTYCDATKASASDTVGGDWPDIGFGVPAGQRPLERTVGEVELTRAHIAFSDDVPNTPAKIAEQYLDFLARLYFHIGRPEPPHVDWVDYAERSRADLERCADCWSTVNRGKYPRAYVGDDAHPPESMVLLAILIPLVERERWNEQPDPLASALRRRLPAFFDPRIDSVSRWLPAVENDLPGEEPHEGARIMDSWYLFHPLLNLGRLAEQGDEQARELFLESLPLAIRTAHRFGYDWPIFYDIDTLEVLKAEREPGKGGEQDVPGLYAHVMLQAWELTDDERFLDEAIAAGRSMFGKGFELAYQTNNVAFGMVAMARLHRITGDERFREVAHVLAACLMDACGIWQCLYGNAASRATFLGIFPLVDAPYTAAYEEAEVAATCLAYLTHAGDDLFPPLAVLLPELICHATARLPAYYPANIPKDVLTDQPKTGHIDTSLFLPVEDISDGWAKAGTVGQEIYGAGMAFSTLARSYVPMRPRGVLVYCDYPYEKVDVDDRRMRINVIGDPRLQCRIRVEPIGRRRRIPEHVLTGSESGPVAPTVHARFAEYRLPAGQHVFVDFDPPSG